MCGRCGLLADPSYLWQPIVILDNQTYLNLTPFCMGLFKKISFTWGKDNFLAKPDLYVALKTIAIFWRGNELFICTTSSLKYDNLLRWRMQLVLIFQLTAFHPSPEYYPSPILHICHFFYTTTIWGLKILHLKVRKCTTKVGLRQNSVNLHSGAQIHISNYVKNIYTVCKKLNSFCKIIHCV